VGSNLDSKGSAEPELRAAPFTIMLITADDGLERRVSAVLATCSKPSRVVRANPIEAALAQLQDDSGIDAVILDRHTSGWVCAETCGAIARAVRGGVTIGLIGENVVLPMREALASRLDGTYYHAQVDGHLLRRLRALAARRRQPAVVDAPAKRSDRHRILTDAKPADFERAHQSTWARTPTP
jgi:hypothetical protein